MTSRTQIHVFATRTPSGAQWLTEVSIVPPGTDPRRWVDINDISHDPGAGELLYRALLTRMPLQRAALADMAAEAQVTLDRLETITPHGETGEHLTYQGHCQASVS